MTAYAFSATNVNMVTLKTWPSGGVRLIADCVLGPSDSFGEQVASAGAVRLSAFVSRSMKAIDAGLAFGSVLGVTAGIIRSWWTKHIFS
jgi:hypothetical protein